MTVILTLILIWCLSEGTVCSLQQPDRKNHYLWSANNPLSAILSATSSPDCSLIFVADQESAYFASGLAKNLDDKEAPWGYGVFEFTADPFDANRTEASLPYLVSIARKLRRASWCVYVVVMSEDPDFLLHFASASLRGRLLEWPTRLIIVTRLRANLSKYLISHHWTFSMMNALFLSQEEALSTAGWGVYVYLPYSPEGAGERKIAIWSKGGGLQRTGNLNLFPEKYSNFQGAVVNVVSKPYHPYWMEEEYEEQDGTVATQIYGTDGLLLHAVAQALNFTFQNLPTESWAEVLEKIIAREAFISPVRWVVLPERLERFDLSYVYEFSFLAFTMSKPPLKPQWQSLHYPLAQNVWISVVVCFLVFPGLLLLVVRLSAKITHSEKYSLGGAIMESLGTLLGQNLSRRLPKIDSGRVIMLAWLLFAFIIGTAYRGNLTAHLTLPKYPPRPETLEELVEAVDAVGGASYIQVFKEFFSKSQNAAYKKFAALIEVGIDISDWMGQATQNPKMAVTDSHRYMQHLIADRFTKPDGTTQLYIGRAVILPGQSAWAMPHDAPYKSRLDKAMQAAIEAGLYEKWSSDVIGQSRLEGMRRQREFQEMQKSKDPGDDQTASDVSPAGQGRTPALSLEHMQGPLFLLLSGLFLGFFSFTVEFLQGQQ